MPKSNRAVSRDSPWHVNRRVIFSSPPKAFITVTLFTATSELQNRAIKISLPHDLRVARPDLVDADLDEEPVDVDPEVGEDETDDEGDCGEEGEDLLLDDEEEPDEDERDAEEEADQHEHVED